MSKKTLLSGVKPTGAPHIGNYFGAMRQFVELQHNYQSYYMVADYHALNFIQDPTEMRTLTHELVLDYLGIGLNPESAVLFKQSDVLEHTELAWIFDTLTTMPYLMRAHAFKDAEAKNKDISVGTFNYPMLMAADILLYDVDVVPVGQDQKQHIEFTRDTAQKFNSTFGETFKLPEAHILDDVAVVPGTDGQKMSKSYKNTIPLFASREEIQKAVMGIVTDSGIEDLENQTSAASEEIRLKGSLDRFYRWPKNVYLIHQLFKDDEDLKDLYDNNQNNYKALKEALADDIDTFAAPLRERRAAFAADPERVRRIITDGGEKARAAAGAKMREVRERIGVSLA